MNYNIEQTVLKNIITNEPFMRKVLPFVAPEYFQGVYNPLFKQLCKYVATYNAVPTLESFKVDIDSSERFNDETYAHALEILPHIFTPEESNEKWLLDTTEKWCQDRAIHNAIMESISIIDGKHKDLTKNALPELLTKALAISFDTNVGHDYIENVEERFDFYHNVEDRTPFDLDYFNKITKGGLPNKTLNVALAGTGVGKSLFMCHMAGSALMQGKDVLYITMEMAEERIAERIDANLLDCPIDQLLHISKPQLMSKVADISNKSQGHLIIKEYPTGSAHAGHFRALLNELKLKKNFSPQLIFIDYLNICSSSRMKAMGGSINSYTYIKAIAEELRGLAVEFNVPLVTATQTTRSGFGNSDVGLEDTAESFGLPATADLMFALISSEELEALGQIMVKQLKNRYNDINYKKRFVVGVDRSRMRLFDADNPEEGVVDDTPAFDKSATQERFNEFKME
jgi:archaellum biogenesis ATPase FlaH